MRWTGRLRKGWEFLYFQYCCCREGQRPTSEHWLWWKGEGLDVDGEIEVGSLYFLEGVLNCWETLHIKAG